MKRFIFRSEEVVEAENQEEAYEVLLKYIKECAKFEDLPYSIKEVKEV